MFNKIKTWWNNRTQLALCKHGVCDCEVVAVYTKTEGCQEFTRTVKACPHCGRTVALGELNLVADKMNQTFPKPKKKPVKKATKKATKKAA